MKRTLLALTLAMTLPGPLWAREPVAFIDTRLKEAVEDELWLQNPTPADLLGLISLHASQSQIENIAGLEYATNLQVLYLHHNRISDISPLAGLGHLTTLCLDNNPLSDLWPLAGLDALQFLNVHDSRIGDLSALAALRNLETLIARVNQISDLSALSGLTKLRELDLRQNQISDLSPLVELTALEAVDLRGNPVSPETEEVHVPLILANNPDVELKYDSNSLRCVVLSSTDGGSVVSPGEAEFTYHHGWPLHLQAVADPGYVFVGWSGTFSGSTNPTSIVVYRDHDILANFVWNGDPMEEVVFSDVVLKAAVEEALSVTNPTPLNMRNLQFLFCSARGITDLTGLDYAVNLQDLDLRDNRITDLSPLGSLTSLLYLDLRGNPLSRYSRVVYLPVIRANNPYIDLRVSDVVLVDASQSDPNENGTAEHPFDSIQEAIDVAADGATLLVHPGVYRESIDLLGKGLCLMGFDPDPNRPLADLPVITGNGIDPAVRFVNGEDPNCLLIGFAVTASYPLQTGAVLCLQSSPILVNCLIVGNRTTDPHGAAVWCNGSQATLVNCTIADNIGGGLGLIDSQVVLANSILWGNTPAGITLLGAGKPTITYSDIQDGWPDVGNLDTDPLFARPGHWTDPGDPEATVWVPGDYHLKSQAGRWDLQSNTWIQDEVTSPGIDAGDPAAPVEPEPIPNGGRVNLGAYGGTATASRSPVDP